MRNCLKLSGQFNAELDYTIFNVRSTLLLRCLNSKGPAAMAGRALCLFLGKPTRFWCRDK